MARCADLVLSLPFLFSGLEDSGLHLGDSASGHRGNDQRYSMEVSRMGDILLTWWPSQEGTGVVLTTRNFYKTP